MAIYRDIYHQKVDTQTANVHLFQNDEAMAYIEGVRRMSQPTIEPYNGN